MQTIFLGQNGTAKSSLLIAIALIAAGSNVLGKPTLKFQVIYSLTFYDNPPNLPTL